MTIVKKTPLYETHIRYGGRIVEFGGWLLPVQYTGIIEEHKAVRTQAGLFDVSHMGEVSVKGPDALAFLQKLVTNDVSRLERNQVQYTPMCYPDGGTVDDLLIYKYSDEEYLLVINAANIEKDFSWMQKNSGEYNLQLTNMSDQTAQLAVQGPLAEDILTKLTDEPFRQMQYYWFIREIHLAGRKVMLSRTGYTGEDGFEIYCQPEDAEFLWEEIMKVGQPMGLLPAGLGCRDTLRFEVCFPLYGHELSAEISPVEAGLNRFVKLEKEDFNGKSVLVTQKAEGTKRKSAGFVLVGRGVPRAGCRVIADGRPIGVVTTGSFAPSLNKSMGLALIEAEYSRNGQRFAIEIRNNNVEAEVVPKSFYKKEGNK